MILFKCVRVRHDVALNKVKRVFFVMSIGTIRLVGVYRSQNN